MRMHTFYRLRFLAALSVGIVSALSLPAALSISSDFEGGSARVLAVDSETQTIRISPAGDLKRGMPSWWFLRVDGLTTNTPLTLEVFALDVEVPFAVGRTARLNPGWTLPTRAAVSTDRTAWTQTEPGKRNENSSVYIIKNPSPTIWLAWGPPFTPQDAATFVEQTTRSHLFAKEFTLSKSLEGRPVQGLVISEDNKPTSERPMVWVLGRQHAFEIGGSWVTVGFAEWLSGNDGPAKWLRQNAEVVFVPIMDVDHVATGDGGKHALPQDHNRDWSDSPHWPEVAAAQKRLLAAAKEGRMAVFLDVHDPSATATLPMFYRDYPPYISDQQSALEDRFISVARDVYGEIKVVDGKPSKPEDLPIWHHISTPWALEHGNPQTISFTVEIPWNTPTSTPEGYRVVGKKLGQTVEKFLHEGR
jgi:hypothetical protein